MTGKESHLHHIAGKELCLESIWPMDSVATWLLSKGILTFLLLHLPCPDGASKKVVALHANALWKVTKRGRNSTAKTIFFIWSGPQSSGRTGPKGRLANFFVSHMWQESMSFLIICTSNTLDQICTCMVAYCGSWSSLFWIMGLHWPTWNISGAGWNSGMATLGWLTDITFSIDLQCSKGSQALQS